MQANTDLGAQYYISFAGEIFAEPFLPKHIVDQFNTIRIEKIKNSESEIYLLFIPYIGSMKPNGSYFERVD
jgi:hypothetical protein